MGLRKVVFRFFDDCQTFEDKVYISVGLVLAFLWRLPLLLSPEVIRNDGTEYIRIAQFILRGIWSEGEIPPLYSSLIAATSTVTGNLELAGILISVIMGSLLVIPVYYLGKSLYGPGTGFIAAVMAAFQPYLYKYSGSVLTESTYTLLVTTAVLFGWMAYTRGKVISTFLFSLFVTLAYLTRPEAIGFVLVFCAWTFVLSPPGEQRSFSKRVLISGLALLFFIAFASPYLLHLRNESGKWTISKKVTVSVGEKSDRFRVPGEQRKMPRPKPKDVYFTTLLKDPLNLAQRIVVGLGDSLNKFQQVLTPYLALLAVIGLFRKREGRRSWKTTLFFGSYHLFFFAFVLPFFFITQRYTIPLIPITLPWAAAGLGTAIAWLHRTKTGSQDVRRWLPAGTLFLVIMLGTHGVIANDTDHRVIQRDVGLWMKEHLSKPGAVMAISVHESFYAGRPWVWHNKKGFTAIVDYAKERGVRYLVVDMEDEPAFEEDLRKSGTGYLVPVFEKQGRTGKRTVVYEIMSP